MSGGVILYGPRELDPILNRPIEFVNEQGEIEQQPFYPALQSGIKVVKALNAEMVSIHTEALAEKIELPDLQDKVALVNRKIEILRAAAEAVAPCVVEDLEPLLKQYNDAFEKNKKFYQEAVVQIPKLAEALIEKINERGTIRSYFQDNLIKLNNLIKQREAAEAPKPRPSAPLPQKPSSSPAPSKPEPALRKDDSSLAPAAKSDAEPDLEESFYWVGEPGASPVDDEPGYSAVVMSSGERRPDYKGHKGQGSSSLRSASSSAK